MSCMASRLSNDRLPILRLRYRCQGSAGAAGKWREARVAGSWWHADRDACAEPCRMLKRCRCTSVTQMQIKHSRIVCKAILCDVAPDTRERLLRLVGVGVQWGVVGLAGYRGGLHYPLW